MIPSISHRLCICILVFVLCTNLKVAFGLPRKTFVLGNPDGEGISGILDALGDTGAACGTSKKNGINSCGYNHWEINGRAYSRGWLEHPDILRRNLKINPQIYREIMELAKDPAVQLYSSNVYSFLFKDMVDQFPRARFILVLYQEGAETYATHKIEELKATQSLGKLIGAFAGQKIEVADQESFIRKYFVWQYDLYLSSVRAHFKSGNTTHKMPPLQEIYIDRVPGHNPYAGSGSTGLANSCLYAPDRRLDVHFVLAHDQDEFLSFKLKWYKACAKVRNTEQPIIFQFCPSVMHKVRGVGVTKAFIGCIDRARELCPTHAFFYESHAQPYPMKKNTDFGELASSMCMESNRMQIADEMPSNSLALLLGGHHFMHQHPNDVFKVSKTLLPSAVTSTGGNGDREKDMIPPIIKHTMWPMTYSYGLYGWVVSGRKLLYLRNYWFTDIMKFEENLADHIIGIHKGTHRGGYRGITGRPSGKVRQVGSEMVIEMVLDVSGKDVQNKLMISPDVTIHSGASQLGLRVYALDPLLIDHQAGFSHTWGADRNSTTDPWMGLDQLPRYIPPGPGLGQRHRNQQHAKPLAKLEPKPRPTLAQGPQATATATANSMDSDRGREGEGDAKPNPFVWLRARARARARAKAKAQAQAQA